jgi:hypothetical protein
MAKFRVGDYVKATITRSVQASRHAFHPPKPRIYKIYSISSNHLPHNRTFYAFTAYPDWGICEAWSNDIVDMIKLDKNAVETLYGTDGTKS